MKLIINIAASCLLCSAAFAQVDSAAKKMTPPEYGTESPNEMNRSSVQDSLQKNIVEPNDNTSVKPQETQETRSTKNPPPATISNDGIVMKGGVVTVTRNGRPAVIRESMMLENGAQLKADGTILQKDGSSIKLKEGERYDLSGNRMMNPDNMNKSPNAPGYNDLNKNQNQNSQTAPQRNTVPENNSKVKPAEPAVKDKTGKDKNMYLVPDSTLKDYNKNSNPK